MPKLASSRLPQSILPNGVVTIRGRTRRFQQPITRSLAIDEDNYRDHWSSRVHLSATSKVDSRRSVLTFCGVGTVPL